MCDELCRLCLAKDNLLPIFINEQNCNFSDVLYLTTGIKIEPKDGLPQNICRKCKDDVNSAYHLRNRSRESYQKLIEMGFRENVENCTENHENIDENHEINLGIVQKQDSIHENYEDFEYNDGSPEFKVEIKCDRLEQDGAETKWPDRTVKKLSRKEKRQQYLDLVDGPFDPNGPVKCRICTKSVSKWACFISHAKLHLGFNFVCEFCGKSFISTTQLKRHCRSYHGLQRELPCKHCSYLALDNAQLRLHERRMHTFERPYVCDACGASYHSRRCLVQHLDSHKTVSAVQCERCPQSFKSSRQLSRHRYRAHKYPLTPPNQLHNINDD